MRKHYFSSTPFQSSKFLISFFRIGENKLQKEQQKVENKREGEEIQQLTELYQWEQRMERERQVKQKKDLMQAQMVGSKQVMDVWRAQSYSITVRAAFAGTRHQ